MQHVRVMKVFQFMPCYQQLETQHSTGNYVLTGSLGTMKQQMLSFLSLENLGILDLFGLFWIFLDLFGLFKIPL